MYETDSHAVEFSAVVLFCERVVGRDEYDLILDRTLFFPEGGGQAADTGEIGGVSVRDVQIDAKGDIHHFVNEPFGVGEKINGKIDFSVRFPRMQAHSGEHIVSGLIHSKYGFNNVGFHMGSEDVTLDLDGVLEREQLEEIERAANEAVWKNLPIRAHYPDTRALADLNYRSKLDLKENVRIVEIEGIDRCACCAPHVSFTGEIGIIKLLDYMHYKGGIRIHMLAGRAALEDYHRRYCETAEIARILSVKQQGVDNAVKNKLKDEQGLRYRLTQTRRELLSMKIDMLSEGDGNLCLFEPELDRNDMRHFANAAVKKCGGVCAVMSGNDRDGYAYLVISEKIPLRRHASKINEALGGRGGGSDEMLQGTFGATGHQIRTFFDTYDFV